MIRIHRAGTWPILITFVSLCALVCLMVVFVHHSFPWLVYLITFGALILMAWVVSFFRNPSRPVMPRDNIILSPVDGRVVAIEEIEEKEFLKTQTLQVSVFMSPFNVHFNKMPASGKITYMKYHPGKYLVAWHPKSSEENERMTLAFEHKGKSVVMRQVAGIMARKILTYVSVGDEVKQGEEFGFIRFGSRVDLFLPVNSELKVALGDEVSANITELAYI